MYILDASVLIYAFRRDAPQQPACYTWLSQALARGRRVGVPGWVELAVLRINTLPSLGRQRVKPKEIFAFLYALRMQPAYELVEPGAAHLSILENLCLGLNLLGNEVNDAFLAALALERGATLVSADRGFERFAGLRWLDPLDHPGEPRLLE
ncbi:TA system VapC family ribonuclease toxin [uncultured Meiothermus sp.]|uniref:TA system VapC family ribonuclease toxin n=1 Tax=uncultured Meiothermus sp. TaxID=157471 RepID=UPI0026279926|nr:TA system VapC family ribonuclease toxin [uncultured Meiothermus sp.]